MSLHVFAGNPFDRGDVQRRDQQWLEAQAKNPRSRFLPLWPWRGCLPRRPIALGTTPSSLSAPVHSDPFSDGGVA